MKDSGLGSRKMGDQALPGLSQVERSHPRVRRNWPRLALVKSLVEEMGLVVESVVGEGRLSLEFLWSRLLDPLGAKSTKHASGS